MDGNLTAIRNHLRKTRKNFPPKLLQYIAVVLVEALDYMKTKFNIMHRDVKPDNILYSKESKTIKLADFGISRTLAESKATTMVATTIYLPPERLGTQLKAYGIESDVWSVGMVLAEMICGKFPLVEVENGESFKNVKYTLIQAKNGFKIENLALNSAFSESVIGESAAEFINACLQPFDPETRGPRPSNYAALKLLKFYSDFDEKTFDLASFLN